eukprot:symbB.v1.2.015713.t1/scaffold1183.1/size133355/5
MFSCESANAGVAWVDPLMDGRVVSFGVHRAKRGGDLPRLPVESASLGWNYGFTAEATQATHLLARYAPFLFTVNLRFLHEVPNLRLQLGKPSSQAEDDPGHHDAIGEVVHQGLQDST